MGIHTWYIHTVDGKWKVWSGWSSCSVSCGNGQRSRSRSCTNPAPLHGGRVCIGDKTDAQSCTVKQCPSTSLYYNVNLLTLIKISQITAMLYKELQCRHS